MSSYRSRSLGLAVLAVPLLGASLSLTGCGDVSRAEGLFNWTIEPPSYCPQGSANCGRPSLCPQGVECVGPRAFRLADDAELGDAGPGDAGPGDGGADAAVSVPARDDDDDAEELVTDPDTEPERTP